MGCSEKRVRVHAQCGVFTNLHGNARERNRSWPQEGRSYFGNPEQRHSSAVPPPPPPPPPLRNARPGPCGAPRRGKYTPPPHRSDAQRGVSRTPEAPCSDPSLRGGGQRCFREVPPPSSPGTPLIRRSVSTPDAESEPPTATQITALSAPISLSVSPDYRALICTRSALLKVITPALSPETQRTDNISRLNILSRPRHTSQYTSDVLIIAAFIYCSALRYREVLVVILKCLLRYILLPRRNGGCCSQRETHTHPGSSHTALIRAHVQPRTRNMYRETYAHTHTHKTEVRGRSDSPRDVRSQTSLSSEGVGRRKEGRVKWFSVPGSSRRFVLGRVSESFLDFLTTRPF